MCVLFFDGNLIGYCTNIFELNFFIHCYFVNIKISVLACSLNLRWCQTTHHSILLLFICDRIECRCSVHSVNPCYIYSTLFTKPSRGPCRNTHGACSCTVVAQSLRLSRAHVVGNYLSGASGALCPPHADNEKAFYSQATHSICCFKIMHTACVSRMRVLTVFDESVMFAYKHKCDPVMPL